MQTLSLQSTSLRSIGGPGYRVCVSIGGGSGEELLARAQAALAKDHRFLELRFDGLPRPLLSAGTVRHWVERLTGTYPAARLLATCRGLAAGGGFAGSAAEEAALLLAAAAGGAAIVDLAVESAEQLGADQVTRLRGALHAHGAMLLLSHHDYISTPSSLPGSFERLGRFCPDIVKVVSTAGQLSDSLAVLALLERNPGKIPLVAIAMGEPGLPTRVLGLRAGALFTFASAAAKEQTAPGQPTAEALHTLYRADALTAGTRLYGVAGLPIEQSLSPLMHNTAFASAELDAVFLPLASADAQDVVRVARELPLQGLAVTMPLKQSILPLLDSVDPLAARVGACNTVVRAADGTLHGTNTDVAGIVVPLAKQIPLPGARVLVLGAGGAARAAVFGLIDCGAEVWILNRTRARAEALAAESGAHVADASMLASGCGGKPFDALIHAAPMGMRGSEDAGAGFSDDPLAAQLVFEMVYTPRETPLVLRARQQGLPVILGETMFVHQGARQFELWTGQPAPAAAMAAAVSTALHLRETGETPPLKGRQTAAQDRDEVRAET